MKQKEYDDYVDMFASEGWKMYIKAATELEEVVTKSAVDNATTNDQWQYCRGMTHQLRSVIGYENFIVASREQQLLVEAEEQLEAKEAIDVNII